MALVYLIHRVVCFFRDIRLYSIGADDILVQFALVMPSVLHVCTTDAGLNIDCPTADSSSQLVRCLVFPMTIAYDRIIGHLLNSWLSHPL